MAMHRLDAAFALAKMKVHPRAVGTVEPARDVAERLRAVEHKTWPRFNRGVEARLWLCSRGSISTRQDVSRVLRHILAVIGRTREGVLAKSMHVCAPLAFPGSPLNPHRIHRGFFFTPGAVGELRGDDWY